MKYKSNNLLGSVAKLPFVKHVQRKVTHVVTKQVSDWVVRNGMNMIKKEFTVTLNIDEADNRQSYRNFLRWLKTQVNKTSILNSLYFDNDEFNLSSIPVMFKYDGHYFYATRAPHPKHEECGIANITMLGRDSSIMEKLYNQFRYKPRNRDDDDEDYVEINVYNSQPGGEWDHQTEIHPRHFSSITMTASVKNDLLNKLEHFKTSENFYKERGLAYKLGLILHGRQGTGKTSIIKAIATYLNYDIYQLNFRDVNNENIMKCLQNTGPNSVIVIEEFDACGGTAVKARDGINEMYGSDPLTGMGLLDDGLERDPYTAMLEAGLASKLMSKDDEDEDDDKAKSKKGKGTRGGIRSPFGSFAPPPRLDLGELLKSFDGLIPLNNRVIILTSNVFKKMEIDPALTRKGRIDGIYELKEFETPEVVDYAEKMFPGSKVPEYFKFKPILGCDIQDYYLDNKYDFNAFINSLPKEGEFPLLVSEETTELTDGTVEA